MKRVEPTLEQWKKLYEIAGVIKRLKPWEFMWEDDIVTIQLPGMAEPVFCSAIGRNGEVFAIIIYPNLQSFAERQKLISNEDLPFYISMSCQNCLMCNFADREELSKKDLKVIKTLELKFRGKGQWIYFNSIKSGYVPYIIDADQADIMIKALENYVMTIRSLTEQNLKVDFENGKTLMRVYSPEQKLWFNFEDNLPEIPPLVFEQVTIKNDLLVAGLKNQKKANYEVDADIFYMPTAIQENKDVVPHYPLMCILADRTSGTILKPYFLNSDDNEIEVVISLINDLITEHGRPRAIHVRDEKIEGYLKDLCKKTNITLDKCGKLETIDFFVESFIQSGI